MGFFKDVHDLSKRSKEMNRHWDVQAQVDTGLAKMRGANEMMAAMAQGGGSSIAAAISGVSATAMITEVRTSGTLVNMSPVLELDLLVLLSGRPPVPVSCKELVPQHLLARAQAGSTVNVRYEQTSGAVFIDWLTPVS